VRDATFNIAVIFACFMTHDFKPAEFYDARVADTKVNLRKNENMGVPTFTLSFTLTDVMRNYT